MTKLTKSLNAIDEYVNLLEAKNATLEDLTSIYRETIANNKKTIANLQRRYAERGEEIERCGMQMEALRKQNKNWRNRVEKLRDKNDKLGKEGSQLYTDHAKALEFIDNICEMVACDATFDDIADECIRWRKGEWTPTEDEPNEEPHRWAVYVVEEKGNERIFTGFYTDYNLARESVDLMVARGCYEAWVEDKA